MKTIIILIFLLVTNWGLFGQSEKEEKITGSTTKHIIRPKGSLPETRLILSGFTSDIVIEGSNRTDIEISSENYEAKPERADGLRSLSDMAAENTQVGLNYEFKGSEIHLTPAVQRSREANYTFKVPNSIKIKVAGDSFNHSDIRVKGMTNEVEVTSQSGDIVIDRVTGPIVAKTMSGNIEIIFTSLNQKLPSSINSISGDIDLTLSPSDKGSFSISSISGEVFTDLDLKVKKTERSIAHSDIDVDVLVDVHEKLEKAMVQVEKETARAMKEMEKGMDEEVRRENKKSVVVVVPDSPHPPQVPFHFNWASPSGIGSKFEAILNGGGIEFNISSISGDVYLRKAE